MQVTGIWHAEVELRDAEEHAIRPIVSQRILYVCETWVGGCKDVGVVFYVVKVSIDGDARVQYDRWDTEESE